MKQYILSIRFVSGATKMVPLSEHDYNNFRDYFIKITTPSETPKHYGWAVNIDNVEYFEIIDKTA